MAQVKCGFMTRPRQPGMELGMWRNAGHNTGKDSGYKGLWRVDL